MRSLAHLSLLPRLRSLSHPLRRLWEWFLCTFVRCGWFCRGNHGPVQRSRRVNRVLLGCAVVLAVSSVLAAVIR